MKPFCVNGHPQFEGSRYFYSYRVGGMCKLCAKEQQRKRSANNPDWNKSGGKHIKWVKLVCPVCGNEFELCPSSYWQKIDQMVAIRKKNKDYRPLEIRCSKSCSNSGRHNGGRPAKATGNVLVDEWEQLLHDEGLGMDRGQQSNKLTYGMTDDPRDRFLSPPMYSKRC